MGISTHLFLFLLSFISTRGHDTNIPTFEDSVIRLNAQSFDALFYKRESAWMLLVTKSNFHYAHRFEYIFVRVANTVKAWNSISSVGVLDCEDLKNIALCRKFHVKRFPQILFLPADVAESNVSYPYSPERYGDLVEQTPSRLKNLFIDFLSSDISKPTVIWPELSAFPELDQKNIWYKVPPNVKSVAIIFDSNSDYFGREVILNTLNLRGCITVVRGNIKTAKFDRIKHYNEPFMIFSNRAQGGEFLKAITNNTTESFVDYLTKYVEACGAKDAEMTDTANKVHGDSFSINARSGAQPQKAQPTNINNVNLSMTQDHSQNGQNKAGVSTYKVYMQDLESAINYIFNSEVRTLNIIVGDELQALKAFIQAMYQFLPASNQIKLLLSNFHNWLNEQSNDISSELYDFKIHDLKTRYEHKFEETPWVGCKGSKHYYRGYPCSLWMVFHTMTVNYYKMNSTQPNFDPMVVLYAIRDYVINFFGCVECVNHYFYLSENLRGEVKTKEDSVLWLWKAHNKLNKRVMMENNEDPFHPNMQFPSEEQCDVCQTFVKEDGDIQWNEQEVLNFLIKFYSDNLVWGSDFQRIY